MAQVNFRIDDETKRRAEKLFSSMGLTMSGAITIFIQQTLNRNEIPFPVQGAKPPTLTKEELLRRIHRRSMINRAAAIALVAAAGYALYKLKLTTTTTDKSPNHVAQQLDTGGLSHEEALARPGMGGILALARPRQEDAQANKQPSQEH